MQFVTNEIPILAEKFAIFTWHGKYLILPFISYRHGVSLQEIQEFSFGFTVKYAFMSLGPVFVWISVENQFVPYVPFCSTDLFFLLALLIFLISVMQERYKSLHTENITPISN